MHTFPKVCMSLQSVRLAHFLHTFFREMQTLCILCAYIFSYNADFMHTNSVLCRPIADLLQTFCTHGAESIRFHSMITAARPAGPICPKEGEGVEATAAAAAALKGDAQQSVAAAAGCGGCTTGEEGGREVTRGRTEAGMREGGWRRGIGREGGREGSRCVRSRRGERERAGRVGRAGMRDRRGGWAGRVEECGGHAG